VDLGVVDDLEVVVVNEIEAPHLRVAEQAESQGERQEQPRRQRMRRFGRSRLDNAQARGCEPGRRWGHQIHRGCGRIAGADLLPGRCTNPRSLLL